MSVFKCSHCKSYATGKWFPRGVKIGPWSARQYDDYAATGGAVYCSEECRDAAEPLRCFDCDRTDCPGPTPTSLCPNSGPAPAPLDATGKCPWCEQRQRLTFGGRISTHTGDPGRVCPGSGMQPTAAGPQPGEIGYRHPYPPTQIEWDGDH